MAERDPLVKALTRPNADSDFAAWVEHQVAALREGRFGDLDIDDLTDEVEGLARRDFKKLRSHLRVIITHMLKWDYQPERRDVSWRKSINASRERVWGELATSPSFRARIAEAITQAFPLARMTAWDETGIFALEREPSECPYTWEEIMHRPHEIPCDRVPVDERDPRQGDLSEEDD